MTTDDDNGRALHHGHVVSCLGGLRHSLSELDKVDPDDANQARLEILQWALSMPGAITATQGPHTGYLVILGKPVRDETAHQTLNAIAMIRGVAAVEPIPADVQQTIATRSARIELEQKLWEALR